MHAWDPAFRAASDAWGDLPETVRTARSTIYLPPNRHMTGLATDLFRSSALPPRKARGSQSESEASTIHAGVLGLATHVTPLIRRLIPGLTHVRHASAVRPWGYSITYLDGERSVTLVGMLGGDWNPHWGFDAWGWGTEMRVSFPPSYVAAGSSTATIRDATGSRTWRFDQNGYHHEWLHLADVVDGRLPPAISVPTVVEDLRHAVLLADAAVAWRRAASDGASGAA